MKDPRARISSKEWIDWSKKNHNSKFNKWTVIGPSTNQASNKVSCRCECGRVQNVRTHYLVAGTSRSCAPCGYRSGKDTRKAKHERSERQEKQLETALALLTRAFIASKTSDPSLSCDMEAFLTSLGLVEWEETFEPLSRLGTAGPRLPQGQILRLEGGTCEQQLEVLKTLVERSEETE